MSSFARAFWLEPLRIFAKVAMVVASLVILLVIIGALVGGPFNKGLSDIDTETTLHPRYSYVSGERDSKNQLLLINVEGIILGSPPEGFGPTPSFMRLGVSYGYAVQRQLEKAAEETDIKGVFLRLQTPGGTIFGSRAIFDGIKAYQAATKQPVIVYIEGLSASGGVMAMVAADAIYADYGSIIGSIGVLGPSLMYFDKPTAFDSGLFSGGIVTEEGIEQTVISAGRHKDIGNPFRRVSEEELAILQTMVDEQYDAFIQHVASARDIQPNVIRDEMGAHLFSNQQAQDYHLIDGTLNQQDALAALAEKAGLTAGDYQLVQPRLERGSLLTDLIGISHPSATSALEQQRLMQQVCDAIQMPLVYYGDATQLCRR